jgi:tRNA splicing endonuclease
VCFAYKLLAQITVTDEEVEHVKQEIITGSNMPSLGADDVVHETQIGSLHDLSLYKMTSLAAPIDAHACLRRRTFRALYHSGYTLTSGLKFGADFLCYPGASEACRVFER